MRKILRLHIWLALCAIFTFGAYAQQQPTREQLLKLFYEAHAAEKVNDVQKAISSYTQILKLSPGLPDPYLQLGNLYATMTDALEPMQKARICYLHYLKLKPDATGAVQIKQMIEALSYRIEEMEKMQRQSMQPALAEVTDSLSVREEPEVAVVTEPEVAVAEPAVAPDSVPRDTLPQVIPVVAVPTQPLMSVDVELLGRWISEERDISGREMWIFDMMAVNDEMRLQLNDSSFVKRTPLFAELSLFTAKGVKEGDELVFRYEIKELKAQRQKRNRSALQGFDAIVNEVFNVDWTNLNAAPEPNIPKAPADTVAAMDSVAIDSLPPREPVLLHEYELRLTKQTDRYLTGVMRHRVKDLEQYGELQSEQSSPIELYHAPGTYYGFSFSPMSEEEKASKRAFRILLNEKTQEAIESVSALNDLGCLYASGVGIRRNLKMAVAHFMEASMKNNLFATLNLAQLYATGMGVEKNLEKARELYEKAYETGYTDAMVLCGDAYLADAASDESNYKTALVCYQKAVFKRSPFAAYRLGWLYYEGLGVEKDPQNALKYFNQAANMSYAEALAEMGWLYSRGELVEKDYAKALELLNKAAAKGNARAMYLLSQMYLKGEGVDADFNLSREWLTKSMEAEDKLVEGFHTLRSRLKTILQPQTN